MPACAPETAKGSADALSRVVLRAMPMDRHCCVGGCARVLIRTALTREVGNFVGRRSGNKSVRIDRSTGGCLGIQQSVEGVAAEYGVDACPRGAISN